MNFIPENPVVLNYESLCLGAYLQHPCAWQRFGGEGPSGRRYVGIVRLREHPHRNQDFSREHLRMNNLHATPIFKLNWSILHGDARTGIIKRYSHGLSQSSTSSVNNTATNRYRSG